MDFREQRTLQLAIAASLALHALVLLFAPGVRVPPPAPVLPTLTAVLNTARILAEPARSEPEKTRAEPPQPQRPVAEARPKPEAAKPGTPAMTAPSVEPAPAIPASSASDGNRASAPSSSPGGPPAVVASAAPGSSASRAEPADPNALQNYKVQLAAYAAKYRKYPASALRSGWEGIAEVKLTIGPDGRIREAVIAASSGHEILDQQAIEMVRKAAPITEISAGLRNREFTINLPIVFNIERKGG